MNRRPLFDAESKAYVLGLMVGSTWTWAAGEIFGPSWGAPAGFALWVVLAVLSKLIWRGWKYSQHDGSIRQ